MPAAPERFPVRNRIIAALADVVVVVEATLGGGARITAQYGAPYGSARVRGTRVAAQRGGGRRDALLADGAQPLVDWSDVVLALG